MTQAQPLIQVRHDYPDKRVLLDVWEVLAFAGEPHGAEGQPLAWVAPEELVDYSFPAANQPIVTAARLPQHYLITPDGLAMPRLLEGIARALDGGIRLIQLRAPSLPPADYRALAERVLALCAGRAQLMLKAHWSGSRTFPARVGTSLPNSCGRSEAGGRCKRSDGWQRPVMGQKSWHWQRHWR